MPHSLSADQRIQFAWAVGLEVNLASYGLLQSLLLRALGTGNLGVRGQRGRFPFPCVVESFVGDPLASPSPYSSFTGSGFSSTVASDSTV